MDIKEVINPMNPPVKDQVDPSPNEEKCVSCCLCSYIYYMITCMFIN